jgi:integrase
MTREGERLTYWGLRQIVRRRAELAGVAEPGLHDFRRAFCLSQLQAGVPETIIARLMGHTTTQLIARYARQTGTNLQEHYTSPVDDLR